MERLMDDARQLICLLHQPVVLGAGAGDADSVSLLERIRANHERGHLAGQNDQRDRIHQRVGQAGHRIGGAGARGHQHNTGLAGRAGIAFGGMHRTLLVPDQNVLDGVLLKHLIINR